MAVLKVVGTLRVPLLLLPAKRRHTECAYYFEDIMRFLLMPIRTNKQGVQINVGKDGDEYKAIVNTMTMHPEDMKELGVVSGATIRVRTEIGEAEFQCKEANVPRGMLFVPYGPPTCLLMGGDTDGTGMPTSKGWDVEVEAVLL